jgi:hypothetical protein
MKTRYERKIKELIEGLRNEGFQSLQQRDEIVDSIRWMESAFTRDITIADDKPFKESGGQFRISYSTLTDKFEMEASYSNQKIDRNWLDRASRIEALLRKLNEEE